MWFMLPTCITPSQQLILVPRIRVTLRFPTEGKGTCCWQGLRTQANSLSVKSNYLLKKGSNAVRICSVASWLLQRYLLKAGELLTITVSLLPQVEKLPTPPTVTGYCWKQPLGNRAQMGAPTLAWNCLFCCCCFKFAREIASYIFVTK